MRELITPPLFDIDEYKEYEITIHRADNISVVKSTKNSGDPLLDIACTNAISDTLKRIESLNGGHATVDFADLAAMTIIGRAIDTTAIAEIIRTCVRMVNGNK